MVGSHPVIAGLSGGVDSAVAAALVQRAVGDQLTCVFVDHGLLREGEREQVKQDYVKATGVRLHTVHARRQFLDALAALPDPTGPEAKRKAIGREFIRAFEGAAAEIIRAEGREHAGEVRFLVQGTLYPDVVESGGGEGAANIKSHHNVGGCPTTCASSSSSPCAGCSRTRCGRWARSSACPRRSSGASRSPGRGWPSGSSGAVTEERLSILRRADAIVREELSRAGLDREIWQCPVVLLADVRSVGVQGDGRTYGHPWCCARSAARTP